MDTEIREQIVDTLDKIRPYIQRDGEMSNLWISMLMESYMLGC
jgi:hypothetical protein